MIELMFIAWLGIPLTMLITGGIMLINQWR